MKEKRGRGGELNLTGSESRGAESKGSSEHLTEVTFTCGAGVGKPTGLNIAVPAASPQEPRGKRPVAQDRDGCAAPGPDAGENENFTKQEIQLLPRKDLSTQLTLLGTRRVT